MLKRGDLAVSEELNKNCTQKGVNVLGAILVIASMQYMVQVESKI